MYSNRMVTRVQNHKISFCQFKDEQRAERPVSASTTENVDVTHDSILQDPWNVVKRISKTLIISDDF
jgi:hypothetical protein